MFSRKIMKKKGGITGILSGNKQIFTAFNHKIFQTKIFSLRYLICKRKYTIRECIACPLFSKKGSLTVETALILPLFLLASLTILSFVDVMKMTIEQQMRQQELIRSSAVYANFLGTVAEGREGDYLKLDYIYPVALPIGGFGYEKVYVRLTSMVHIFNGYDDSQGDRVGSQQEYVYVTEQGSVYHKKRSCPVLNVTIREVSGSHIRKERNVEQKKYKKCQTCTIGYAIKELEDKALYVTEYGTSYHVRINCPDLTRTIKVVKIEEAGGKPACKSCR